MKVSYFPGCTLKNKARDLDAYAYRVAEIISIFDEHSKSGLSNREILRRFVHPKYPICERTFYNMIKNSTREEILALQSQNDGYMST